jgi:hypothetical protein
MGSNTTVVLAADVVTASAIADDAFSEEHFDPDWIMRAALGMRVNRAAANLPATTTEAIFTITGGEVLVTCIYGKVGTVIQTQACNTKLQANPTATGSSVDICANLDITAKAADSLFNVVGVLATALGNGMAVVGPTNAIICPVGTIDLVTAATNTGTVAWTLFYIPLVVGARVTAA